MATNKKNTHKTNKPDVEENIDAALVQREYFRNLSLNILSERFFRVRELFLRLTVNTPQALLIEGGTSLERLGAALFLGALLNCEADKQVDSVSPLLLVNPEPSTEKIEKPCCKCNACKLFMCGEHRDLILLDGRFESIKIEAVRDLRNSLGTRPNNASKRIVIFSEAHNLVDMAGQALLKTLEEPKTHTLFILCTSQRERLLPTLVSRSWVITLPWQHPHGESESVLLSENIDESLSSEIELKKIKELEQAFINMIGEDTNYVNLNTPSWLQLSSQKGYFDKYLGLAFVSHCRRELCLALGLGDLSLNQNIEQEAKHKPKKLSLLAALLSVLDKQFLLDVSVCLDEAESDLTYGLNPSLVMDCFATKLFLTKRNLY
ncbi:hypothetical protein [Desulfovibrio litoralis]|uniref:DNA polymerase-3 subunit delta n=1 Tax=Desulfovibrio litoralis DSM 11393 TaxID=1121455 RepID=A0A1M7TKB2_9BACT|nr:hypothetical protein [Desulfovibrio litoralis]SHN71181.1 DNA polymerase-3 subunit delta' [Desulfovibrio litoralis DSM 11393]